jgi:hypothetical protein
VAAGLPRAAEVSSRLRRERERAFYGDVEFIPTERYSASQAGQAYDDAAWVLELAGLALDSLSA